MNGTVLLVLEGTHLIHSPKTKPQFYGCNTLRQVRRFVYTTYIFLHRFQISAHYVQLRFNSSNSNSTENVSFIHFTQPTATVEETTKQFLLGCQN